MTSEMLKNNYPNLNDSEIQRIIEIWENYTEPEFFSLTPFVEGCEACE